MKTLKVKKVVRLPDADGQWANSVARVHSSNIDASKRSGQKFHRRQAVAIENPDNGNAIVRMVVGAKGVPGLTKEAIAIDYDGMDALGFRQQDHNEPVDLVMREATDWDLIRYYWDHPDLGYRTAHRIAAVSFIMGLIGLFLGIVPLF